MSKTTILGPARPSPKKPSRKKKHWWHWPWLTSRWAKIVLACAVFVFAVLAVILLNAYSSFSRMIDRKLAGEVFQNTAKVYATPLTVFPGQVIRPWDITNHLRKAGYSEKGKGPTRIGEYSYSKSGLEIVPHEDSYYGSSGGQISVEFSGKAIARILSRSDRKPLNSYELEPLLITNLFDKSRQKRRLIQYEDIPKTLRDAVLAIEDRRFFEHSGFDPIGIVRAAIVDVLRWERSQGASTITQQVVRNFWLTPERRWVRKLKEIYMSTILETRLTKEQIFTLYANDAYLGQRASFSINGFGEAAT